MKSLAVLVLAAAGCDVAFGVDGMRSRVEGTLERRYMFNDAQFRPALNVVPYLPGELEMTVFSRVIGRPGVRDGDIQAIAYPFVTAGGASSVFRVVP